jgi:UDP-N-acetylmuramoyl-L-alanyl-D-glutamate--2,6-diaminopimelate ligase
MTISATLQTVIAQINCSAPASAVLRQDSRAVKSGDVFVAFSGGVHDGRDYIDAAFKAGASCVLAEAVGLTHHHARIIAVADLKQQLGSIASAFYGRPSVQLDCVGITGTNGKTTVAHYVAQLLQALQNKPAGIIGTLGAGLLGNAPNTGLTTPHASEVHRVIADCAMQGAGSVVLEATSIGLEEGRLNGVAFKVAAFTNLTQDHLDYHGDMRAYGEAKRRLFDWAGLKAAVINIDDSFGADVYSNLQHTAPELNCITTGFKHGAMLRASDVHVQADASQTFTVTYQGRTYSAQLAALGSFNVHNALTALGCVLALGYDAQQAIALLPQLHAVAGRMQVVTTAAHSDASHPLVVVDFAHTPDGLLQALQALRPVAIERGGALHAVFGCGGNRDATKRPTMGAIAQQYADYITITNDNPRDEDAATIAAQVAATAPRAMIELDRATAIKNAIQNAQPADVILIAGKGHEATQTIAGLVTAFSDVAQAQAALEACEVWA